MGWQLCRLGFSWKFCTKAALRMRTIAGASRFREVKLRCLLGPVLGDVLDQLLTRIRNWIQCKLTSVLAGLSQVDF